MTRLLLALLILLVPGGFVMAALWLTAKRLRARRHVWTAVGRMRCETPNVMSLPRPESKPSNAPYTYSEWSR